MKEAVFVVHGWLLIAAWSDLKSRRVSNKWCLIGAGAALGLLLARLAVTDHRWLVVFDRLTGAVLVSSILFAGALLRRGGIGMGDVKVFFVLGLFLGADTAFAILVTTLIIALAAGAVQIVRGKLRGKDRLPLCPYAYVALIVAVLGGW